MAFYNYVGPCPPGMSLDRIDVNGHYEPGNVRWATQKVQCRNKRKNVNITFCDETHCIAEWAELLGVPYDKFHHFLRDKGYSMSKFLRKEGITYPKAA
jgi:hypothetical protein